MKLNSSPGLAFFQVFISTDLQCPLLISGNMTFPKRKSGFLNQREKTTVFPMEWFIKTRMKISSTYRLLCCRHHSQKNSSQLPEKFKWILICLYIKLAKITTLPRRLYWGIVSVEWIQYPFTKSVTSLFLSLKYLYSLSSFLHSCLIFHCFS